MFVYPFTIKSKVECQLPATLFSANVDVAMYGPRYLRTPQVEDVIKCQLNHKMNGKISSTCYCNGARQSSGILGFSSGCEVFAMGQKVVGYGYRHPEPTKEHMLYANNMLNNKFVPIGVALDRFIEKSHEKIVEKWLIKTKFSSILKEI